jgi:ATP-dependent Clp protease ATP-binding subunit ClpA
MARLIQSKIKQPLVERILFGDLQSGGVATADVEDGELVVR